jgi:hypothetical protein
MRGWAVWSILVTKPDVMFLWTSLQCAPVPTNNLWTEFHESSCEYHATTCDPTVRHVSEYSCVTTEHFYVHANINYSYELCVCRKCKAVMLDVTTFPWFKLARKVAVVHILWSDCSSDTSLTAGGHTWRADVMHWIERKQREWEGRKREGKVLVHRLFDDSAPTAWVM